MKQSELLHSYRTLSLMEYYSRGTEYTLTESTQCRAGSAGARPWVTVTAMAPYLGPARSIPVLIHKSIFQ